MNAQAIVPHSMSSFFYAKEILSVLETEALLATIILSIQHSARATLYP
jgi:hypothetical protein